MGPVTLLSPIKQACLWIKLKFTRQSSYYVFWWHLTFHEAHRFLTNLQDRSYWSSRTFFIDQLNNLYKQLSIRVIVCRLLMINRKPFLHIIWSCLLELILKIIWMLFSLIHSSLWPCQHRAKLFKLLNLIFVTTRKHFSRIGSFLQLAFSTMENQIDFS